MNLTVHQFPCLQENYCFLVRDARSGAVACIDPPAGAERVAQVRVARGQGQWTVPTTIELELTTNPFLRAPTLYPRLEPMEAFAALRAAKDAFIG